MTPKERQYWEANVRLDFFTIVVILGDVWAWLLKGMFAQLWKHYKMCMFLILVGLLNHEGRSTQ